MKLATLIITALVVSQSFAEIKPLEVKGAPFELTISVWDPPARKFSITEFGAKQDGKPVTEAMDKAIAAANAAGGGQVIIPKGEWICGAFKLKSNVAIRFEDDAILHFPDDPVIVYRAPLRENGLPTATCKGLISADNCTNIALIGKGTFKSDVEYWHRGFMVNPQRGFPRPQMMHLAKCKNVRLEDFKVRGSPAWTMHLAVCEDILMRNVDSVCTGPNTDGLDLEACNRALVEGCSLDQTDDTYTIKSGFNEIGRKRNIPTQNVVIRNCRAVHGHSLLGIGSEVSGGIRNIYMTDCTVESECWNWLFVKTNSKRGAYVDNVTMENIKGRRANMAIMNVEMFYDGNPNKELGKKGQKLWCTAITNIVCRNVVCEEAARGVKVRGDTNLPPVGLRADNIRIGRLREDGRLISTNNVGELKVTNVRIDPSASREILKMPKGAHLCNPEKDADSSVSFERVQFEELSENEVSKRVIGARIAAEIKQNRNCAPKITPVDYSAMSETLDGNRTKRLGEALAEYGCALKGAIIADDVRKVYRAASDGLVTGVKGLKVTIEPDEKNQVLTITIVNGTKNDMKDVWGTVLLPMRRMTRRQIVAWDKIAAGQKIVKRLEFGAGAHYMPMAIGENLYAFAVDFSLGATRTRVWATKSIPVLMKQTLPHKAAMYIEPTDKSNIDEDLLSKLSGEDGALPVLGNGVQWKKPYFEGSAWYNCTDASRPYTDFEKNLIRCERAREVVALQCEVPARAKVKVRVLPWLWDKKVALYINGAKVPVNSKYVEIATKPGLNRIIVSYKSKPGERRACTQIPVFTWSVTDHLDCVPFKEVNVSNAVKINGAVRFPLEWNTTFATEVPHEVEISREKLNRLVGTASDTNFKVTAVTDAGEQDLTVKLLPGRVEGVVLLRFTPPKGTKALFCEPFGHTTLATANDTDNIFAGALNDITRWKPTPRMRITKADDGALIFSAKESGSPEATITYNVTPELAGKNVRFESTIENMTDESWATILRVAQLDKDGKQLPESVVDYRWTALMQPPHTVTPFSERGHIHPEARKLVFKLVVRSEIKPFDKYGMKNAKPTSFLASFKLSRLALRVTERLPFPKYDEGNFTTGVSGKPGDYALALGGTDEKAFWYQTRSLASWSDAVALRKEEQLFYPIGAGTVEAWFKSEWKSVIVNGKCCAYPLFKDYQGYRASECRGGKGDMMSLAYLPEPGELQFSIKDYNGKHCYEKNTPFKLPKSKWCHLAAQWNPQGTAEVYVDGKRVIGLAIPEWVAPDLSDDKTFNRPNDEGGHELFVGSTFNGTRWTITPDPLSPFVEGWVDALRVSTGKRYKGDFTPAKEYVCDKDTRALFNFDRSFDGVSGGGIGWIPGTTRGIQTGRVDRKLTIGDTKVQYWAAEILPENDPHVIFDIVNFPKLPTPDDFEAARAPFKKSADMKAGEVFEFDAPDKTITDYIEIANTGNTPLSYPIVLNDGDIDPRSYGDLVDTMKIDKYSPRERVNKVFAFVLSATDYFMNHTAMFDPGSDKPKDVEYRAMLMLNGYCGFECGPLNNMAANLFVNVAHCPAAQTGGYGHSFEEVFYDGKNHVYDLSAQKFFPAMDNETAAYLEEGGDEAGIFPRMGNPAEHFIRKSHRGHWVQSPDCVAKVGVTLNQGESFKVWFMNDGQCNDLVQRTKFGVYKGSASKFRPDYTEQCHADTEKTFLQRAERFFPHYYNGYINYNGRPTRSSAAFTAIEGGKFCYSVNAGGYPIVYADYKAIRKDGSVVALEISTDNGKTFRPFSSPATYAVRARYAYLIRVNAPIDQVANFSATTEVQMNPRIYPGKIKAGKNRYTFKVTSGETAKVTIQGRVPKSRVSIPAAVSSGVVVGSETLFYAFDPKNSPELEVKGVSKSATVRTTGAIKASLTNGKLKLMGDAKDGVHFAGVTIVDDGAEKELTVLVGTNVRLATAANAKMTEGAKLVGPDKTSPQARAWFGPNRHNATARFNFDAIPKGKYSVLELNRFRSHPETARSDRMRVTWPGQKSTALGEPRNWACNYKKANYGRPGERANFKWDYADHPGTGYPYSCVKCVEYPAADHIEVRSWRDDDVEVAAMLIVPECSADVRGELVKHLCGFNTNPWRIKGGNK